jgi:hypothetical protein
MSLEALAEMFAANGGVATTGELLTVISSKKLEVAVRGGKLIRVRRGVYALKPPDLAARLAALELASGMRIVACMQTAAEMWGFDTEVEIGRTLRRPRALAVLDAALHVECCSPAELTAAVTEQKGRRGIIQVRALVPLADSRAESPMESEARLVFIDGGLPLPELQFEIVDRHGKLWRVDFAWPDSKVVAEYESVEWHANPEGWKHDRMKTARLQESGWTTVPMVVDDVRKHPYELVTRIFSHLERGRIAG